MSATYSIGEVARRVGLSTSALRYYEQLGLLPEPERVSGRRRYDGDALDRLAMIDIAQRAGLTLREAGVLLGGLQADTPPTDAWRELADRKLAEIEQLLARTAAMRDLLQVALSCDCLSLEDIDAFRQANAEWAHAQQRTPSG
ncbi:MAG TPA: MerR family transcriptional regulator [Solirubrobacteraceae bacterium]|nr:MerR family transcriptional regulator [Solirubrobacteraceae bacterium]